MIYEMIDIELDQVIKDLKKLGADETTKELILNNVRMYNKLVFDYEILGIQKNVYLTYQLSVQISKQILELRRFNKGLKEDNPKEKGGLPDLIKSLKKEKRPNKK